MKFNIKFKYFINLRGNITTFPKLVYFNGTLTGNIISAQVQLINLILYFSCAN